MAFNTSYENEGLKSGFCPILSVHACVRYICETVISRIKLLGEPALLIFLQITNILH